MMDLVQTLYRSSFLSPIVRARQAVRVRRWYENGHVNPPPHFLKQRIVRAFARRYDLDTFIETGTYLGDMVAAMRPYVAHIYSIELDVALYAAANRRFRRYPSIHIFHGDSAEVFPNLLPKLPQPCLFWLDGHYSGDGTARGANDTPIVSELDHILARNVKDDIVLIDDARCFVGSGGYPTIEELAGQIENVRPSWQMQVHRDIIRFTPRYFLK